MVSLDSILIDRKFVNCNKSITVCQQVVNYLEGGRSRKFTFGNKRTDSVQDTLIKHQV